MKKEYGVLTVALVMIVLFVILPTFGQEIFPMPWDGKHPNAEAWSSHIRSEIPNIGKSLLAAKPLDRNDFCPNFDSLSEPQKIEFYAQMFSKMSEFESSFKPEATYSESFSDAHGSKVISRGLLQISIESANGYGCGIKIPAELHLPAVNLSCAVRIMDRWVSRDGSIAGYRSKAWRGGARYWSVLRGTPGRRAFVEIKKHLNSLPFCKGA